MNQKRIGMLFDIENLFYAARKDPGMPSWATPHAILLALVRALKEFARGLGTVEWKIGACSWIEQRTADVHAPRTVLPSYRDVRSCLIKKGYTVLFVPGGKNAADYALTQTALGFTLAAGIDLCILATGDGREPFPDFITQMLLRGVALRVAAYDYAPENIRMRADISYGLLGSDVRNLMRMPEALVEASDRISARRPRTLRDSVRRYYEAIRSGARPSDIPTNHIVWIEQIIRTLRALTDVGTPWELKFSEILNALRTYTHRWDPRPSADELAVLLAECLDKTDLFGKTSVYTPNWQSVLWTLPS